MRRWVLLLLLALLAVPTVAANTGDWTTLDGTVKNRINAGECIRFSWTTAATLESKLIYVGTLNLSMNLIPDDQGITNVAGTATVLKCSGDQGGTVAKESCREALIFDSDLDGFPDDGTFSYGVTPGQQSRDQIHIAGFLYVDPDTNCTGTSDCAFVLCAEK